MIVFENKGVLDIRAVKIMGISAKDDKASAIGYFGTGLKYAIAILLRHGATVSLVTGGEVYEFGVNPAKIRHDTFDVVTMNGVDLGFTTDLGKNWELWMALRELYSNTLDEKGTAYETRITNGLDHDSTYILVDHEEFSHLFKNIDDYFLNYQGRKVAKSKYGLEVITKIKDDTPSNVYYKGVRVLESRVNGMYDYNILSGLTLTEDRTIRDGWGLNYELAGGIAGLDDRPAWRSILTAPRDSYEASINFMTGPCRVGDVGFLDTIGKLRRQLHDTGMNPSAILMHRQLTKTPSVLPGISCYLNEIESKQLERAKEFCKYSLGMEDLDEYQLIVAKDLGSNQLGRADINEGIMYISKQCFREGTKRVAVALLEEYTHCKHRVLDETVEQKWVYLNMIASLGERISGEPI